MEHELLPMKELAGLSVKLKEAHSQFVEGQKKNLAYAVLAGHVLREVKAGIGHGEFGAWVEGEGQIAGRTARVYMNIAQKYDRGLITPLMLTNTTIKKALEAQVGEEDEPKPRKGKKAPISLPAKSARGKPQPGDAKKAIETGGARFKVLLDEIQRLRMAAKKLSGTRLCGEYVPLGEVDKGLSNVYSALKYAVPHARCCYCAKAGGLQEGCHACGGRGWLSKGLHDAAPGPLRKMVERSGS